MKIFLSHLWSALLTVALALLHIACINNPLSVLHSVQWGVVALIIALQVTTPFFWWLITLYPLMLFWYANMSVNIYSIVFAITVVILWALHVYVLKERHLLTRVMLVEIATVIWTVGVFGARAVVDRAGAATPSIFFEGFWVTLGVGLIAHALLIVVWTSMETFVQKRYEA